jgi:protein O-GlcNAc transferase
MSTIIHSEAIQWYDKALEIYPNWSSIWNNKGYSLNKLGIYNDAIKCYDRDLQLNPNFPVAWNNKQVALNELQKKKGWFR